MPLPPKLLTGLERDKALFDLEGALAKALQKQAPESFVADISRQDPSLLLERCRFTGLGFNALNYIELARMKQWVEVVEVGLQAGIHPDDRDAFCGRTLLEMRHEPSTLPGPALLALGLRYGADASQVADSRAKEPFSLARTYLKEVRPLTESHLVTVASHFACLRQLLEANPGRLDPAEPVDDGSFAGAGFLVALGDCLVFGGHSEEAKRLSQECLDLMRLAIARGADVDWRVPEKVPTVYSLAALGRIDSAVLLLENGAEVSVPPARGGKPLNASAMVELVTVRSGPEAGAQVQETLMRRRVASEREAPAPLGVKRRRLQL